MYIYVSGRLNVDYIITLSTPLKRGEKAIARDLVVGYGGTGGNIATAIARFLERKGIVRFVGCIGRDEGLKYLEVLASEGIDVSLVEVLPDTFTGRAILVVELDGTTTVISYPGANDVCRAIDRDKLEDMAMLVVANPSRELAHSLISYALDVDAKIVVDPSRGWIKSLSDLKMLTRARECYFVPNEVEFLELTRRASIDEALKVYLASGIPCKLIVKRGARGAMIFDPQSRRLSTFSAIPLEELGFRIATTAGCGDTFTGVLSAALYEGRSIREAVELAIAAAGLKATRKMTRDIPRRREIFEMLERAKNYISSSGGEDIEMLT